ncbi:hypothetical protein [Actinoplanes sp. NPDC026623]|uniref:hypothetical protein n=1 Tax=Actinoplanes sp. NPDC026623 TaxID=3155610 RepID=UPI0034075E99
MRTRARRAVDRFNACVLALRSSPRLGKVVSRSLTVVTYTGRRSGTTFSIPVGYRRTGDVVTIGVAFPDAKSWWRNFTGDGAPLTVHLDGADRPGHGLAHRDAKGRVTVTVRL